MRADEASNNDPNSIHKIMQSAQEFNSPFGQLGHHPFNLN